MRLKTAEYRRVEHALEQLEKRVAPRVSTPLQLDAETPPPKPGEKARRAALIDQLGFQLLTGRPGCEGPHPSLAIHEEISSLFRHKHLATPEFTAVEQAIAASPANGPAIFGPGWKFVAHLLFGIGKAVRRPRAQLEPVDFAAWRRARWAEFLASDEGKAAVEAGLVRPAASDLEAMEPAP